MIVALVRPCPHHAGGLREPTCACPHPAHPVITGPFEGAANVGRGGGKDRVGGHPQAPGREAPAPPWMGSKDRLGDTPGPRQGDPCTLDERRRRRKDRGPERYGS